MGRYTRLRPVHSLKHIIDVQGGLIGGTQQIDDLVEAVDAPVVATVDQVETASQVGSIFLNVQVVSVEAVILPNVYMVVMKNPGNNLNIPQANAVGGSDEKRFVIHQEMIMVQALVAGVPRTLFKGVIKIPRGYKRFGIKDKLQIALLSPGVDMFYCIQCIYKEFR